VVCGFCGTDRTGWTVSDGVEAGRGGETRTLEREDAMVGYAYGGAESFTVTCVTRVTRFGFSQG
jgi:hypothetical protein